MTLRSSTERTSVLRLANGSRQGRDRLERNQEGSSKVGFASLLIVEVSNLSDFYMSNRLHRTAGYASPFSPSGTTAESTSGTTESTSPAPIVIRNPFMNIAGSRSANATIPSAFAVVKVKNIA
jgi:hypothetical protein